MPAHAQFTAEAGGPARAAVLAVIQEIRASPATIRKTRLAGQATSARSVAHLARRAGRPARAAMLSIALKVDAHSGAIG